MEQQDIMRYALNGIMRRKTKTFLTALGIVIGIAAIIVLVGLADGMRNSISDSLQAFGKSTLVISPSAMGGSSGGAGGAMSSMFKSSGRLYENDVNRVKRSGGVELATGAIRGSSDVDYKGETKNTMITGIEPDLFQKTMGNYEIEKGRDLEPGDRKVVIVGGKMAKDGYKKEITVGSIMTIAGNGYRVAGVLKEGGDSFSGLDNGIFMDMEDARETLGDTLAPKEVNVIRVKVRDGMDVEEVSVEIENDLAMYRRVPLDQKDFSVVTPKFISDQVDSVLSVLTLFLGGVAGIALIVAGIGISNTMFMSVLERRREIGVLKSMGALNEEVLRIFVYESAIMGLIGGVAGLLLGFLIVAGLGLFGIRASVSLFMAAFAFLFSMAVGIVAGAIPAKQAAELNPIDALRYE